MTHRHSLRAGAVPIRQYGSFNPGTSVGGAGEHWGAMPLQGGFFPRRAPIRFDLARRMLPNELIVTPRHPLSNPCRNTDIRERKRLEKFTGRESKPSATSPICRRRSRIRSCDRFRRPRSSVFFDSIRSKGCSVIGWQLIGYPGPLMNYRDEIDKNHGQPWRRKPMSLAQSSAIR